MTYTKTSSCGDHFVRDMINMDELRNIKFITKVKEYVRENRIISKNNILLYQTKDDDGDLDAYKDGKYIISPEEIIEIDGIMLKIITSNEEREKNSMTVRVYCTALSIYSNSKEKLDKFLDMIREKY